MDSMEESVFYISQGKADDKHSQESFALATSSRTSQQHASFRNADSPRNGAVLTGMGPGERLFAALKDKALLSVYTWGKESADQKMPMPEQLSCLTLAHQPQAPAAHKLPSYRVPWLLAAGSRSGKLYIWELASGSLVCVRESHYQEVSCVKFSACGTYLITAGLDARVLVWRTQDLIAYNNDDNYVAKPYYSITDNTLAVLALEISQLANANDLKLYTASHDGTLRVYDLASRSIVSTFVLLHSIECLALDPAYRAIYVGLANGTIRVIPLYRVNKNTKVLESVGGNKRIITVEDDMELRETFVHHQGAAVVAIAVSFDGMSVVSGDAMGRVFVSDVVTKQTLKSFNPCSGPISYIQVAATTQDLNEHAAGTKNKKHRLIPQLKRQLMLSDPSEHVVHVEIPELLEEEAGFDAWLDAVAEEELEFRNLSMIASEVKQVPTNKSDNASAAQEKLDKVSQAYTELRLKYEELVNEHNKLVNER